MTKEQFTHQLTRAIMSSCPGTTQEIKEVILKFLNTEQSWAIIDPAKGDEYA